MKIKLQKIILCVLLFGSFTITMAQEVKENFENMVNYQYGTLLESLMKDGKLNDTDARTYLETVFGYDENLKNYLQAIDLSKQIISAKTDKLALGDKVMALNTTLLSLVPENYKQNLLQNPSYLGWKLGQEMDNGGVTTETLQNVVALFADGIKKNKENKIIVEKLKALTPRAENIRSTTSVKKVVLNDINKTTNWKLNPEKIKKGFFSIASTFNKVTIESGNLVLDPVEGYQDKFLNIYKNKEKFDFSKDFKITIKGKLDVYSFRDVEYQASNFSIVIGQYYLFDAYLMYAKEFEDKKKGKIKDWSAFSVKTPSPEFTTDYGIFTFEDVLFFTKGENIRTVTTFLNKDWAKSGAIEDLNLNFNNGFELVILSKDGFLSLFMNGTDTGLKKQLSYLPNKFSFDIKANIDRKTIIESVKLEHL